MPYFREYHRFFIVCLLIVACVSQALTSAVFASSTTGEMPICTPDGIIYLSLENGLPNPDVPVQKGHYHCPMCVLPDNTAFDAVLPQHSGVYIGYQRSSESLTISYIIDAIHFDIAQFSTPRSPPYLIS